MIDTTVMWTSVINSTPAVVASLATLAGLIYTTKMLHTGQVTAAEKAVAAAADVKKAVETEAQKYNDKLDTIHHLVNSALGSAYRALALISRRLADVTKDPQDIILAKQATKVSDEHDRQQAASDLADAEAGRITPPPPRPKN